MQICNNCLKETNFTANGLCGQCMGFEQPDGILDSGLAEGQTGEITPIINKYWAIDYKRLGAFEAEVDKLVGMHKHELVELLALESAMISTISYAMVDARLKYGMLVRRIERGDGQTELVI